MLVKRMETIENNKVVFESKNQEFNKDSYIDALQHKYLYKSNTFKRVKRVNTYQGYEIITFYLKDEILNKSYKYNYYVYD